jgi:hypothetical protein
MVFYVLHFNAINTLNTYLSEYQSRSHYVVMQMFSLIILFALFILEGSPTFGTTPDSVCIGYHARVNSRVMDIQITDVGDFIQKMELEEK